MMSSQHGRAGLALLLSLGLVACASSTGNKPAKLERVAAPEVKSKTLWSASAGEGDKGRLSGLTATLDGDRLYAADVEGRVMAIDAANGDKLWTQKTAYRFLGGPGVGDGLLLLGTLDGEVVALSSSDGAEQWVTQASSEVLTSPVMSRGVVIARGGDGRIFGLDADSGSQLWVYERATPALTLRGTSAPVTVGRNVYLGLDTGEVVSLDIRTGEPEWQRTVREATGRTELERIVDVDAELLVDEGRLFAVSYGGELAVLTLATGRELWRRNVSSYAGMAFEDGRLYLSDSAGHVLALDADTGARIWEQEALSYRRLTGPAMHKGNLVVGDYDGYLHWLSPADGTIVGRSKVAGAALRQAPQPYGGALIVISTEGDLRAIDTKPTATAKAAKQAEAG